MKKRILNIETKKYLRKKVRICGWVNSKRSHGKIVFLDLRDKTGILQIVCQKELAEKIKEEDVLQVEGKIEKRPKEMINPKLETGEIELRAEKIKVLAKSKVLPFDLKLLKLKLPKLLNFRPLSLRNQKIQAIFKIQETIIDSFRKTMKNLGFFEFQSPIIVASATEGGAQLFPVDYYKYKAYLAQSPQLYKQILVSAFERVFCVTKAFRAEPSMTTRHLSEYISLDCEMGFIEGLDDLLNICEVIIKNIFLDLEKNRKKELEIFNAKLPKIEKIPKVKFREAKEILFERTKKDKREESDLDPEEEKEICDFSKEKFNSELIFVTHFPAEKRPFYTFPDPKDKKYTLSFDLLFRGMEIATGGQRISDYKMLLKNIKKFNLNPKNFQYYLQAFKYGMPPEGGFALGAERITKQILNLENIREATLFPRDMERVDLLFSSLKKKKMKK
jgi:nondiscriminating aspartyl-tRNA synthetase